MSGIAVKRRKQYVGHQTGKLEICLIQGSGNSSDEFKVLRDFGAKYDEGKPNKVHGNNPVTREKNNRHQKIKRKCCKGSTRILGLLL